MSRRVTSFDCLELQMIQLSTMNHDPVEHLREQIVTAFAATQPSSSGDLAYLPEPAEGEERHLELELQGRSWTAFDRDFWLQWWPSLGALLPASYRYYLPSLLLLSLGEPSDAWELVSGTLSVLTPSFRRLLDFGRDRRFEYQTSLFNPEQRATVCSFLGLLLATSEWRFRSAEALKFGWNQIEHPALQQCREFYAGLHSYTYPPMTDDEQCHLIESIRDAFEDDPIQATINCAALITATSRRNTRWSSEVWTGERCTPSFYRITPLR
jgi:hypothetical protein